MCVIPGRLVVVMSEAGGRTCSQIRLVSTTQGRLVGKKKDGRTRDAALCVAARLQRRSCDAARLHGHVQ